jgi:hypothetical protein
MQKPAIKTPITVAAAMMLAMGCRQRQDDGPVQPGGSIVQQDTAAPASATAATEVAVPNPEPARSCVDWTEPKPGAGPRRWTARRGRTVVYVTDQPGMIVDSNAPPPAPGVSVPRDPRMSASCSGGDMEGCATAGELRRNAGSAAEFVAKLCGAGFDVREDER